MTMKMKQPLRLLLLPRGSEEAGFYHLSFQEFLAAQRLHDLREDLAACLQRRAATAEWRRTLMFLFCATADARPQVRGRHILVELQVEQASHRKKIVSQKSVTVFVWAHQGPA